MCEIRLLDASDIEVRAQQVSERGAVLLLYKNARVDMAILDEKFGMFGWQREHTFKDGKNYCKVSIWDCDKKQWVSKEDIGTESNTEAQKGEASDAFKRACFNIGIGRELYTAPFIWVALSSEDIYQNSKTQKWQLKAGVYFEVTEIAYDDKRNICRLRVADQKGNIRFEWPKGNKSQSHTSDPIESAQPITPQPKKRITMSTLENKDLCDKWLNWAYGGYMTSGYSETFDAGACLLKFCDADADVVDRFSELFESYCQARKHTK